MTDFQDFDGQFEKATEMVGAELLNRINGMANVWLPALELVKAAFESRHETDKSGRIVKFSQGKCLLQKL